MSQFVLCNISVNLLSPQLVRQFVIICAVACTRDWERACVCVCSLISVHVCTCVFVCVCGLYCSAYCEVAQCALRSGQTPPELKSFSSLAGFQAAPRDAGQCFRQEDTRPVPPPSFSAPPPPHTLCYAQLLLNVPRMPWEKGQTSFVPG